MESLRSARNGANLPLVTEDESREAAIKRRFEALGISDREWYRQTGIDIKTVHRAADPGENTRESTYTAIEAKLRTIEDRVAGRPTHKGELEGDVDEGLIEFRISGNFGVSAVVKGPINNRAEVEESAMRLLREMNRD